MNQKSRSEHLQWCKDRALEHCKRGELLQALASMESDLWKHPETNDHPGIVLGMELMLAGKLNDVHEIEAWINGFN